MDLLFKYWPLLVKLNEHKAEISQIQTLLGPTIAELQKVWPKVQPLLVQLSGLLAPTFTELSKVWGKLWPLLTKLVGGLTK